MMDMLLDYALFLAKTLTILAAGVLLVVMIIRARHATGSWDDGERLDILDLNEHYRDLARALKQTCLSKKEYRAYLKAERKREKAHAKAKTAERQRLFVVDFSGDIRATEVAALRVLVTTILLDRRVGDAVLVRIENAGGTVHEHGLAASQLARLRAKGIHLTVAVDKIAASGGYLMACVPTASSPPPSPCWAPSACWRSCPTSTACWNATGWTSNCTPPVSTNAP